jgi:hypothetical protein
MKKEEEITIQEYECETGCGVHILKGKKHICSECWEEQYGEYGSRYQSEYGPEEIEEEHARIRRNNDYNENNSYNEKEYNPYGLEVNTSFTLGLSLSNGGKRLLR